MATTDPDHQLVDRLLTPQPLDSAAVEAIERLRNGFKELGHYLVDHAPAGPDRNTAIRKLQNAQMWCVAAVALNQEDSP